MWCFPYSNSEDDILGYYTVDQDYDRARELLRSFGFTFNERGKLNVEPKPEYATNTDSSNESVAAFLLQNFAKLVRKLTIKIIY